MIELFVWISFNLVLFNIKDIRPCLKMDRIKSTVGLKWILNCYKIFHKDKDILKSTHTCMFLFLDLKI